MKIKKSIHLILIKPLCTGDTVCDEHGQNLKRKKSQTNPTNR